MEKDLKLLCRYAPTLPPILSQASLEMLTKPLPLQADLPLQELSAVLQSLLPLHLFIPKHLTWLSELAMVMVGIVANIPAAATANAIPAERFIFIYCLQVTLFTH